MRYILFLALFLLFSLVARAQPPVRLTVPAIDVADFSAFVDGRKPLQIDEFSGTRRDIAILVLQLKALRLGGYSGAVDMRIGHSHKRILATVMQGHSELAGMQFWRREVEANRRNLWATEAVIRDGEFEVGLYTAPYNGVALKARSLADVRQLRAVSSRNWPRDWQVLLQLKPAQLYSAQNWPLMVKMLDGGRADFTLSPFYASEDLSTLVEGRKIVPIPGIKLAISSSQHWIVSRRSPIGEEVYRALEAGLAELRARGEVTRALTESGFFQPAVASWRSLNLSEL